MASRHNRIVRFVGDDEIAGLLADFDPKKNILRINHEIYKLLPPDEQAKLWRVESAVAYNWRERAFSK